ncbi:tellurite resistance/C4-dicarboxylate transporter family protein [Streptomyces sp. NPDC051976]|uniref:tellurite resistance/C4-dicarboxylate transporter family protein n=1 Tax=Streptomyces sp. NPDC051976 TaxID=3154947 RepID=UPI0034182178
MHRQLGRVWAELPPAAGSAVMATGIISVDLEQTGRHGLSLAALAVAALLWLVLAADFGWRLLRDRARFRADADTPPALTAVAATAVLGTRLSLFGWQTVAAALLALAAVVWPALLVHVVRRWKRRMPGGVFLVCVAAEGLAVLAAVLSTADGQRWLAWAALVCFLLGLVLYPYALARFDFAQIMDGAGDHWISAGALAICALAGSKLTASPVWTGAAHTTLRTTTLVLLGLALAGYVLLAAAEVRRPRPHYDMRRWATVFPLGMTSAAALSTSAAAHIHWLHTLGEVLLWIAAIAWTLAVVGAATATAAETAAERSSS